MCLLFINVMFSVFWFSVFSFKVFVFVNRFSMIVFVIGLLYWLLLSILNRFL